MNVKFALLSTIYERCDFIGEPKKGLEMEIYLPKSVLDAVRYASWLAPELGLVNEPDPFSTTHRATHRSDCKMKHRSAYRTHSGA